MRFQWKVLVLILATTLIPIIAARTLGVRSVRRVGDNLVERVYYNRIQGIQNRLQLSVDAYSAVLWSKRELIEVVLESQHRAVASALAMPAQGSAPDGKIEMSEKALISEFHTYRHLDGRTEKLPISLTQPVLQMPPQTDIENHQGTIQRQLSLTSIYKQLYPSVANIVYWHFTVLEGGITGYYPGYRQITTDYDIRSQAWFQGCAALKSHWSDPFVDSFTGQTVVAAVRPVSYPDGHPAGWTGLMVPIGKMLADPLLAQNMVPETMVFVGYVDQHPQTGTLSGRIMAGYSNDPRKSSVWGANVQGLWLTSTDTTGYATMIMDIREGRGGAQRMHYQGQDALWVYGPLQLDTFLVLVTPYASVIHPAAQAETYLNNRFETIIRMTGLGLAVILILVVIVALFFSKTVTKPIQALFDATQRLGRGDLNAQVAVTSNDEIGYLCREFNRVVPRLKAHYALQRSVALAREVQQNLLPHQTPRIPGMDIAGQSIYCEATGGDYYDFWMPVAPAYDRVGMVVGDVSDHGLQSALLMSSARALLRQRFLMPGDLPSKISAVNRLLCEDVRDSGQFVTLFLAELEISTGRLHWIRAGHDPAILYYPNRDVFENLAGQGMALGVMPGARFEARQCLLEEPAILVIGTDGIWESQNPQGHMFGMARFREIVRANAASSAMTILNIVFEERDAFSGDRPLEDDVTLTVVKIFPHLLSPLEPTENV